MSARTLYATLVFGLAFTVTAAQAQTLKCAVHDFMPISGYANTEAVGVGTEVAREAFKRAGITIQIESRPFARLLQELKDNALDCGYAVAHSAERAEYLRFSKENLATNEFVLYAAKGKDFPFQTPADLKGKKIGIVRGYFYGPDFDAAMKGGVFTTEETPTNDVNFQKLAAGRIDALAINALAAREAIKAFPADSFTRLPTAIRQHPTHLVFNKTPAMEAIALKYDAALAQMHADGSWARIVAK